METSTNIMERLIRLQRLDRVRDRLQKKLDEVPRKLKRYTDALAAYERVLEEQRRLARAARSEADRAELEVRAREQQREKIKRQMNAPKLTNREYEALQETLAGVLADINSLSDSALKALERAEEAEGKAAQVRKEMETLRAEYEEARARLEASVQDVREELERRNEERAAFAAHVPRDALAVYERVRRKHPDALAAVEGTIDRAAGRIGNDLHCSACYMTITANDAVRVLRRDRIVQCKSCVRILYVP